MKPDDRKGKLRICKATDGLTHLMWGPRAEGMPFNPDDDFIIFPQEAQMKFIPKPGCFVIKFPDDASRNKAVRDVALVHYIHSPETQRPV